ncbi:tRNA (adenosine(37)-N6)-threonylcarbamoyltransferase complex ATPase subunit type 1 TsaE [Ornithinicoccus halotolerans]|uniref:tRNA (adenosine(37)-N6)-threonylcarbamoyltransferase complex ATPase subunit type 1 TsaE n=1 Tax=Ornithinicoccus halotolerans TaxID=1748220 RepID=UPI001296C8EF|nr:tRNA (adenosine(37)-N6)-threonylcarbamoyltransferase complex ATPase subunit type 1 TsaE [Ornithinicoccus halotolerans]
MVKVGWAAEDTRALGRRLAAVLRAGDLVVLTGSLGAGKTTFTQGLGEGLGVRGPVTSPTFVIARVHPSLRGGPALVHVDAYRLGGVEELEDLDLEASVAESVTVAEWGEGLVEQLAEDRLVVRLERSEDPAEEARLVRLSGHGDRWESAAMRVALHRVLGSPGGPDLARC